MLVRDAHDGTCRLASSVVGAVVVGNVKGNFSFVDVRESRVGKVNVVGSGGGVCCVTGMSLSVGGYMLAITGELCMRVGKKMCHGRVKCHIGEWVTGFSPCRHAVQNESPVLGLWYAELSM